MLEPRSHEWPVYAGHFAVRSVRRSRGGKRVCLADTSASNAEPGYNPANRRSSWRDRPPIGDNGSVTIVGESVTSRVTSTVCWDLPRADCSRRSLIVQALERVRRHPKQLLRIRPGAPSAAPTRSSTGARTVPRRLSPARGPEHQCDSSRTVVSVAARLLPRCCPRMPSVVEGQMLSIFR